MIRTTSETTPTICEGRTLSTGKRNRVTLVRTVVIRKIAVQPLTVFEPNMAATTTNPARIPTRLKTTCNPVNADIDIPRTMISSLFCNFESRDPSLLDECEQLLVHLVLVGRAHAMGRPLVDLQC